MPRRTVRLGGLTDSTIGRCHHRSFLPRLFQRPEDMVGALGTTDAILAVDREEGHAPDAELLSFVFVDPHRLSERITGEHRAHLVAVKPDLRAQPNQRGAVADVHEANQRAGMDLLQVYPNPFQERTVARYTTQGGHVQIQVFTAQGALVTTVVSRDLPAGTYTADIDLGPLPAGSYYCRLQNGRAQQVRTLLKWR